MRIRAKVQVQEKRTFNWAPNDVTVIMRPIHAGTEIPEAEQYSTATPSGMLELQMKKPVADQFEMGKYYDVLFTPIEA